MRARKACKKLTEEDDVIVFDFDQVAGYTTAEMVADVAKRLDLSFDIKVFEYKERIGRNDTKALSHFLLNECIGYSFDRDTDATKKLSLQSFFQHSKTNAFLNSFLVGEYYEFPQAVWLISLHS